MPTPVPDVRYWPLDEESGDLAIDQVDGVEAIVVDDPSGDTNDANGKFGYCRNFGAADGGVSHLDLWQSGAAIGEDELTQYTLTSWVRLASASDSVTWSIGTPQGNTGISYLEATITGGPPNADSVHLVIGNQFGGTVGSVTAAVGYDLSDDDWHLIVIRCDGSETDIIVDDVVVGDIQDAVWINPSHPDFTYGGPSSEAHHRADDLRVYSWALSNFEVGEIWNDGEGDIEEEFSDVWAHLEDPLGILSGVSFVDWTNLIDPITTQVYYALELDDGELDPVRLPMSSWQATLQLDRSSYVQAVVPSAGEHVGAITDRQDGTLRIYRGARFEDGSTQEVEIATAPMQRARSDEGPTRHTMTLSGYAKFTPPEGGSDRVLQGVRSISTDNGVRARCELDWWLRPGQVASVRGVPFDVAYINYYVTAQDEYMDVGERPL